MASEGIATIVRDRCGEVLRATDDGLAAGVEDFLRWLFRDERMQPLALDLLRRESLEKQRFLSHQTACFRQAAKLLGRLWEAYPHKIVQRVHACKSAVCRVHMEELEELLWEPRLVDAAALVTRDRFVDATPAGRALACLRACAQEHIPTDDGDQTLRDEILVLWMRHQSVCRRQFSEVRSSPAMALRTLMTHQDGTPGTLRSAQDVRSDLKRVCCELQMAGVTSSLIASVLDRYRERCERFDADRIRELGRRAGGAAEAGPGRELTLDVERYLHDHNLAVWAPAERSRAMPGSHEPDGRPVVVQSAVYGRDPRESVVRAILEFHALLAGMPRAEGHLILFHVDERPCIVPRRLEFADFPIGLVHIDVIAGADRAARMDPVVLSRDEIMDEVVLRVCERSTADRRDRAGSGPVEARVLEDIASAPSSR